MNNFVESLLTRLGFTDGERTYLEPLRKGIPDPGKESILTSDQSYFKDYVTQLKIEQNFLVGSERIPGPKIGKAFEPKGIVIHFSASYNVEDTIKWYEETTSNTCHLLLDKVGRFHQMTNFNVMAEHAGDSYWKGYKNLDKFFIGIEVVGLGPLSKKGEKYFDCYGRQYLGPVIEKVLLGCKYWEPFTAIQLSRLVEVCSLLSSKYKFSPSMICGHFECSYGRRLDPGGSLIISMDELRAAVTANNWETLEEIYSGNT